MSSTDDRIAALSARRTDSIDAFAPQAHHRGAPDLPAVRNPTMLLAVLSLAAWFGGVIGYLVGPVPFLIALSLCVFGVYVGFTVLHESVHRVAHRNRRINDGIGRPFAWLLWFNYPVFRTCHLRHHANTNDAVNDPDHWVSHGSTLTRPFYLLTTPVRYWVLSRRHGWLTRRQLWAQTGSYMLGWVVAGSLAISGNIGAIGILFLPTIIAGLILYYCLDYLPHLPFDSTERYLDTRIQPGRVRHALLLGQNYHLIHHLWVSVPWFRYRDVFHEVEPGLRARGSRID